MFKKLFLICLFATPVAVKPSAISTEKAVSCTHALVQQSLLFPFITSMTIATASSFYYTGYLLFTHETFPEQILGLQKNIAHYTTTVYLMKSHKKRLHSKIAGERIFSSKKAAQTAELAANWTEQIIDKDHICVIQPSVTLRDGSIYQLWPLRIKATQKIESANTELLESFIAADTQYQKKDEPLFFWFIPFAFLKAAFWLTIEMLVKN